MNKSVIGASTREEGIALRRRLHSEGFERLGFVRLVAYGDHRIGADVSGRVYHATKDDDFGWGPWRRANTKSFDRYVRHLIQ